ncbi:MAG: IclR family transcriptional regulator [Rhizobacter sp.]|nr:IclR family transcriptional regulator [Rhizobacter sp.]
MSAPMADSDVESATAGAKAVAARPRPRATTPKPKEDRHFVTALARGLEVLACFRAGNRTFGNAEIAQRCKLPKSTVSRLTATLLRLGYLIQVSDGRYRLGTASLSLGSAMLARLDVRTTARPVMQELADFSRGMVSLGARDRLSMIYIENCRSSAALTLSLDVGSRIPVARTSMGRAWLAAVSERDRSEVMARIEELDESAWPEMRQAIDRSIADYRSLGVTCSFGDWQKDVNAIARAFEPGGGLPPMAISCGGPSYTVSKDYLLNEVRPLLIEAVKRLEATLR